MKIRRSYRGKLKFSFDTDYNGNGRLSIRVPREVSSIDHQMQAVKFMRWLRETADWIEEHRHHLPVKGG